ncbi:MAG: DUF559 domain-containing protein [Proteobacteria bacterium]|nr:DUF559 domain-containing protein [Pseudomonadota bacterium]
MFTKYRPDLKAKAKLLRKEMTPMEKKLWFEFLRVHPRYKFLGQKPVGDYIVDFYCSEKKLVIEVDGDSHFLDQEAIDYDLKRTEFLQQKHQIKVIRFCNSEVMQNFSGVCEEVERVLGC